MSLTLEANRWKAICIVLAIYVTTAIASPAQTFKTLATFNGTDGVDPINSLAQGTDGNFYGTAGAGGHGGSNCFADGCGTVFKSTQAGALIAKYRFCATGCADGLYPQGLVLSNDGNFYGVTYYGGNYYSSWCELWGCGTVFKITPKGNFSTLYSFCSDQVSCFDGSYGNSQLVQGADGNFYGTTREAGANGGGTVFKITPAGTLTTLYSFCSQPSCFDGSTPQGVILASDGNFYGTTNDGGTSQDGTVFKLTPDGALTTLHSFSGADGSLPNGQLIQATNGDLYGMTWDGGGGFQYFGTVFKITLDGTLTTLHRFSGADGWAPAGRMVQATNGNLYGVTSLGGTSSQGTVFTISLAGILTTLYNFCSQTSCDDGDEPLGGLTQGTDGLLYGTTSLGGGSRCNESGCGSVFSLDVGLTLFVSLVRDPAKVGQRTVVLGQGLTGTSGVSFNGTPASYTVQSDTFLVATVPNGATTGFVTVTTPNGVLTSNKPFQVVQ